MPDPEVLLRQSQQSWPFRVSVSKLLLVGHRPPCSVPGGKTLPTHGTCSWRMTFTSKPVCATCRVPLSCNKTAGGDTVVWIGFELLRRSYQLDRHEQPRRKDLEETCTSLARQNTRGVSSGACTSSSRSTPRGTTRRRISSHVAFIMSLFWNMCCCMFHHFSQRSAQPS